MGRMVQVLSEVERSGGEDGEESSFSSLEESTARHF